MPSPPALRIINQLDTFAPHPEHDNAADLEVILGHLRNVSDPEAVLPSIFGVLERNPEADLGSPGPLVHEAEAIEGYSKLLSESVARRPSLLTLWMVNRILNVVTTKDERLSWLNALQTVEKSPVWSESIRREARDFLNLQRGSGAAFQETHSK